MKTLVLGDIHGAWIHINTLINNERPDIVLQCGDFGWWPHFNGSTSFDGTGKQWNQYGLKPQNSKFYFCPGNHENWDSLDNIVKYDSDELMIHQVMDNVFYCEFGATLTLPDGRVVLFVGGADSIDKENREEFISWWRQETISQSEFRRLPEVDIDIVISHTIPSYFKEAFPRAFSRYVSYRKYEDPSCLALNRVFDMYKPKQWFSGHFHCHMKGHFRGCDWEGLSMPNYEDKWWIEI